MQGGTLAEPFTLSGMCGGEPTQCGPAPRGDVR
jgi:hypothetical protein